MSRNIKKTLSDINFDYDSQPKEHIQFCNICGSSRSIVISKKDRYGLNTSACLCLGCGLVYISPRMTAEGYKLFYQKFYRPLVSFYLGKKVDSSTIIQGQKEYAREVFDWMEKYIPENKKTLKLLDVGGSTGIVAKVFRDNLEASGYRVEATVIDPSPEELAVAKKFGLKTIEGLAEEKNIRKNSWDLILLCQTIDHLMDVTKTISVIRNALKEDGLLFVDIVDWEYNVRRKSVRDSIKIDHPFNFTRQTIIPLLGNVGFQIVSESILSDGHLIGFICRKTGRTKCPFSPLHAESLLYLIRKKQALQK